MPGNSWTALTESTSQAPPVNKIAAMQIVASGLGGGDVPANIRAWFQRGVALWATSTGGSLEKFLGIKGNAHRAARLAARNRHICYMARAHLQEAASTRAKAHRLEAIIRAPAAAPGHLADLVEQLFAQFSDVPTGWRQLNEILKSDDSS